MQENSTEKETQSQTKKNRVKRFGGDLNYQTYMSKQEKVESEVNRRTLHKKMLKAYLKGKDFFTYKGEQYPVLYFYEEEE